MGYENIDADRHDAQNFVAVVKMRLITTETMKYRFVGYLKEILTDINKINTAVKNSKIIKMGTSDLTVFHFYDLTNLECAGLFDTKSNIGDINKSTKNNYEELFTFSSVISLIVNDGPYSYNLNALPFKERLILSAAIHESEKNLYAHLPNSTDEIDNQAKDIFPHIANMVISELIEKKYFNNPDHSKKQCEKKLVSNTDYQPPSSDKKSDHGVISEAEKLETTDYGVTPEAEISTEISNNKHDPQRIKPRGRKKNAVIKDSVEKPYRLMDNLNRSLQKGLKTSNDFLSGLESYEKSLEKNIENLEIFFEKKAGITHVPTKDFFTLLEEANKYLETVVIEPEIRKETSVDSLKPKKESILLKDNHEKINVKELPSLENISNEGKTTSDTVFDILKNISTFLISKPKPTSQLPEKKINDKEQEKEQKKEQEQPKQIIAEKTSIKKITSPTVTEETTAQREKRPKIREARTADIESKKRKSNEKKSDLDEKQRTEKGKFPFTYLNVTQPTAAKGILQKKNRRKWGNQNQHLDDTRTIETDNSPSPKKEFIVKPLGREEQKAIITAGLNSAHKSEKEIFLQKTNNQYDNIKKNIENTNGYLINRKNENNLFNSYEDFKNRKESWIKILIKLKDMNGLKEHELTSLNDLIKSEIGKFTRTFSRSNRYAEHLKSIQLTVFHSDNKPTYIENIDEIVNENLKSLQHDIIISKKNEIDNYLAARKKENRFFNSEKDYQDRLKDWVDFSSNLDNLSDTKSNNLTSLIASLKISKKTFTPKDPYFCGFFRRKSRYATHLNDLINELEKYQTLTSFTADHSSFI